MCPLAALRITVCGVLLAADWEMVGGAETAAVPLPVPSLSFRTPLNGRDIELFFSVELVCTPPKEAPYPIVIILGRDTQPRTELLSFARVYASAVTYTLVAEPENEGAVVCWYNASRTGESSGSSNSLNITISIPPPTVVVEPNFIPVGRNYTVYCRYRRQFPNVSLSLYHRDLASDGPLELFGSLALDDGSTGIEAKRPKMAAGVRLEYSCRMEVFYSPRVYKSALSGPVTATAEEIGVRLVSAFRGGPECAGRLEMLVRGTWAPVCQRLNQDVAGARVVCRQLRCGDAALASYRTARPIPQGQFFMGPLDCKGTEPAVGECPMKALQAYCPGSKQAEIVCSAFLPPPVLSVPGHGSVPSLYVHEESTLELACTVTAQWLENSRLTFVEVGRGRTQRGPDVGPGEPSKWELEPAVPGEYVCYATVHGFNYLVETGRSNSVIVTTGTFKPPSTGLIVGALFTTLIGVGMLVYMCVCRVHKEGSQEDLASPVAQVENPVFTPGDDAGNGATAPGANPENPQ